MKKETFEGVMENAYGKKLDTPISFAGEYDAYENHAEVVAAKDELNEKEVVDFRNNQRKANARQKAMQAQLDAAGIVKPTIENDEQLRLRKMYDVLVANKMSDTEAKAVASATLGIAWAD